MKANVKPSNSLFHPVDLIINIETAEDLEILHRLFNSEKNRQADYINHMYNEYSKISAKRIEEKLNPIYEAIQEIRS